MVEEEFETRLATDFQIWTKSNGLLVAVEFASTARWLNYSQMGKCRLQTICLPNNSAQFLER